jgi:hypothetical protein
LDRPCAAAAPPASEASLYTGATAARGSRRTAAPETRTPHSFKTGAAAATCTESAAGPAVESRNAGTARWAGRFEWVRRDRWARATGRCGRQPVSAEHQAGSPTVDQTGAASGTASFVVVASTGRQARTG